METEEADEFGKEEGAGYDAKAVNEGGEHREKFPPQAAIVMSAAGFSLVFLRWNPWVPTANTCQPRGVDAR